MSVDNMGCCICSTCPAFADIAGATEGVRFYLIPDFTLVKERGIVDVAYAVMSQAFFTFSTGIGAMEIFGSYLKRERSLLGEATGII